MSSRIKLKPMFSIPTNKWKVKLIAVVKANYLRDHTRSLVYKVFTITDGYIVESQLHLFLLVKRSLASQKGNVSKMPCGRIACPRGSIPMYLLTDSCCDLDYQSAKFTIVFRSTPCLRPGLPNRYRFYIVSVFSSSIYHMSTTGKRLNSVLLA